MAPNDILVLIEVAMKNLTYLVAVDVIGDELLDQSLRFVQRQSRNLSLRVAATVAIERDSHQVGPSIRIKIEIGKDATALKA